MTFHFNRKIRFFRSGFNPRKFKNLTSSKYSKIFYTCNLYCRLVSLCTYQYFSLLPQSHICKLGLNLSRYKSYHLLTVYNIKTLRSKSLYSVARLCIYLCVTFSLVSFLQARLEPFQMKTVSTNDIRKFYIKNFLWLKTPNIE
jgi:hypothetical protein